MSESFTHSFLYMSVETFRTQTMVHTSHTSMVSSGVHPVTRGDTALEVLRTCNFPVVRQAVVQGVGDKRATRDGGN